MFYRFLLAAILLIMTLRLFGRLKPLTWQVHGWCFVQGMFLFFLNYYSFYSAALLLTSGLLAVVFSTASIMNNVNNWLCYRQRPTARVMLASCLGVFGVCLVFYDDFNLASHAASDVASYALGVLLSVVGTFCFSIGNMLSVRLNRQSLDLLTTTAWSMVYGASLCGVLVLLQWRPLDFSWVFNGDWATILMLFYMVIFGTILPFLIYLHLVAQLGVQKVAYCTVIMPIVALLLSTIFEDYRWTLLGLLGVVLTLVGNVLIFQKPAKKSAAGA